MNSDFYKMQKVYTEGYNGSANQSNYPSAANFDAKNSYSGGGMNGPGNSSPVNNTPGAPTGANTPDSGDLISFPSDRNISLADFKKQVRGKIKGLMNYIESSYNSEQVEEMAEDIQSQLDDILTDL